MSPYVPLCRDKIFYVSFSKNLFATVMYLFEGNHLSSAAAKYDVAKVYMIWLKARNFHLKHFPK